MEPNINLPQNQMNALGQAAAMSQIAMVKEQVGIAKAFPRNYHDLHTRIMKACARLEVAESAIWQYPRGGEALSGPSIHLAKVMAMNFGNIDYGVRELSQNSGSSVVESYCMDLENNVRSSKAFQVSHSISLKGGKKKVLTDSRDIYENNANMGARRLRACILDCIPPVL